MILNRHLLFQITNLRPLKVEMKTVFLFFFLIELALTVTLFTQCSRTNPTSANNIVSDILPRFPVQSYRFDTLNFSENNQLITVAISDTGTGTKHLSLGTLPVWLRSECKSFQLSSKDMVVIQFSIVLSFTYLWQPGYYVDSIAVYGFDSLVYVPVILEVFPRGYLQCGYDTVYLIGPVDSCSVPVANIGNASTAWRLSSDSIIQTGKMDTPLPEGDTTFVQIMFDAASGMTGEYITGITIFADNDSTDRIIVRVINPRHRLYLLDHAVKEAVFSESANRILSIPADSASRCVHIIDPETFVSHAIKLDAHPTCAAVNNDGSLGAVGADGAIYIIDMEDASIQTTYITDLPANDIFMNNHSVYAMCNNTTWQDNLLCITLSTGRYYYARFRLMGNCTGCMHPSGEYLYLITHGASPQDMHKVRLYADSAVYLYDSPYHGNYGIGYNICVLDDKVLTWSGNVFAATDERNTDMQFLGPIDSFNRLLWGVGNYYYSRERNLLYLVSYSSLGQPLPNSDILRFDAWNLICKAGYDLARFGETDHLTYTEYEAQPTHCFPSSRTDNIYVIADRWIIMGNSYVPKQGNSCIGRIPESAFTPLSSDATGILMNRRAQ